MPAERDSVDSCGSARNPRNRVPGDRVKRCSKRAPAVSEVLCLPNSPATIMSNDIPSPDEQLSAEYDSGSISEQTRKTLGSERTDSLVTQWQHIGDLLRDLPLRRSDGLQQAVRAEITAQTQKAEAQTTVTPSPQPEVRGRRVSTRKAIVVACSSMSLVLLGLLSVSLPQVTEVAVTKLPPATVAAFAAAVDASREAGQWDVVVLTLPDDPTKEVPDVIQSVVGDALAVECLAEPAEKKEHVVDVLVASAASSTVLLNALQKDIHCVQEWNPGRVDELDRDELLSKVVESMQTPTRSDEYFGEVFVLLSRDEVVSIRTVPLIASGAGSAASIAESAADSEIAVVSADTNRGNSGDAGASLPHAEDSPVSESDLSQTISRMLSPSHGKPVLVVFKRRKSPPPASRSSLPSSAAPTV
ncbi:MAG: hypothetical protein KDA89_19195 [Planctomycetaceae bacterium]|nr:hypothetical protein [Planctomycetaceae bacterium]